MPNFLAPRGITFWGSKVGVGGEKVQDLSIIVIQLMKDISQQNISQHSSARQFHQLTEAVSLNTDVSIDTEYKQRVKCKLHYTSDRRTR